jgi:hypothetical protein
MSNIFDEIPVQFKEPNYQKNEANGTEQSVRDAENTETL